MLSAVQDALQLLVLKRPDDPLLFLSKQYPYNLLQYISSTCTSFEKLTRPSVDPVQRTVSLLQNYSADDGDAADVIYESFTLLSKGGTISTCAHDQVVLTVH